MTSLNFKTNIYLFIFFILCAGSLFAQNGKIATLEQIQEDVAAAPCKSKERLENVKKLFLKMGAKESDISTEKFKEGENLSVKINGNTDETIIIGAHYDKTDEGCGAVDNWTGISIMAHLYKTLTQFSTNKTYIFVAFDQEEVGLLGSKAMVKNIPKENYAQYCSMINIDSFGFAAPQSPNNMSSEKMIKVAKTLSKEMNVEFNDSPIPGADADSSSFLAKKIPAITFDGLSNNWNKILHTSNDKFEKVNMKSVYLGYRFVLAYIVKVDSLGCSEFK